LAELRDALPTTAALSTLWLEIDRPGLTVKETVHADEQRRPDVTAANQVSLARGSGPGKRLGTLIAARPDATLAELQDELPVRAALTTIWRKIDRLNLTVKKPSTPINNGAPTSPPPVFNGPIDNLTFHAYVTEVLVPTLRPGHVIVLDNLKVHHQPEVRAD
jgi:hypothetical protein